MFGVMNYEEHNYCGKVSTLLVGFVVLVKVLLLHGFIAKVFTLFFNLILIWSANFAPDFDQNLVQLNYYNLKKLSRTWLTSRKAQ